MKKRLTLIGLFVFCACQASPPVEGGNVGCTDSAYYVLEVDKNFPYGNGPWVPMVFGPGDLGKNFAFRVQDTIFGYNCTGNIPKWRRYNCLSKSNKRACFRECRPYIAHSN